MIVKNPKQWSWNALAVNDIVRVQIFNGFGNESP